MALKITERSETSNWVELGETIWRTSDDRLVAEGDPEAAFLLGTAGKRVSREDALRYGLVKPTADEKKQAKVEAEREEAEANATQAAVDLANELGVDLAEVKGTGQDGRITKGDIEAAAEKKE